MIGACTGLVLIAPTLRQHEVVLPAATRIRRKVIVAGQDFATPVGATQAWLSRQPCAGLAVDTFESADHFFKGLEARLANSCAGFCLEQLEGTTA